MLHAQVGAEKRRAGGRMDGWTDGWTYGRMCRHGSVTRFESLGLGGLLFRYPHTQTHTHASLFSFPFFTVFFLSFFLSL